MGSERTCPAHDVPLKRKSKFRGLYHRVDHYWCPRPRCTVMFDDPVPQKGRRVLLLLAGALAAFASVDYRWLLSIDDGAASAGLRALTFVLFAAAIVAAYYYYAPRNLDGFRSSHERGPAPTALSEENYADLLRLSGASEFTAERARVFTAAVLAQRRFRQRVVEDLLLGERSVHQTIRVEARIPAGFGGRRRTVFFPVLLEPKGRLHDDLSMCGADGAPVPSLPYREYLRLTARAIRELAGYAEGKPGPASQDAHTVAVRAVRLVASRHGPGTTPEDSAPRRAEFQAALDALPDPGTRRSATARRTLRELVETLTDHYMVVAVVAPDDDGRVVVRVEQDLIPTLEQGWRERLAVTLGARPVRLTVPLALAGTCDSYHLRVVAPDGLYLADQQLRGLPPTPVPGAPGIPFHYRLRPRLGQSYAHFYSRFLPPDGTGGPRLTLKFFERPPGSTLPAAASAFVTFALVWAIALVTKVDADPLSDVPAWLLVFPALAAAWLGISAPSGRLLEGTFAARLSLALTIASCVAASILFIAHNVLKRPDFTWWTFPDRWPVFWISDLSWFVVFLISAVNAAVIIYKYLTRAAYYQYLCGHKKSDGLRQHA